jgi:hypothetical protein
MEFILRKSCISSGYFKVLKSPFSIIERKLSNGQDRKNLGKRNRN